MTPSVKTAWKIIKYFFFNIDKIWMHWLYACFKLLTMLLMRFPFYGIFLILLLSQNWNLRAMSFFIIVLYLCGKVSFSLEHKNILYLNKNNPDNFCNIVSSTDEHSTIQHFNKFFEIRTIITTVKWFEFGDKIELIHTKKLSKYRNQMKNVVDSCFLRYHLYDTIILKSSEAFF